MITGVSDDGNRTRSYFSVLTVKVFISVLSLFDRDNRQSKTDPEFATELNFIRYPWTGDYQNKLYNKNIGIIPYTIKSPPKYIQDEECNPPHINYNPHLY